MLYKKYTEEEVDNAIVNEEIDFDASFEEIKH
jgi:hypothetical protein